jgi:hypothetical protein
MITSSRRFRVIAFIAWCVATATIGLSGALHASDTPVVGSAAEAQALGGLLPDIVEEVPKHLQVQNTRQREWLRFSTTHWNFGDGPLQIRGGGQIAPCTIDGIDYDECTHASQEVLDAGGEVVASHPAGVALFHPEHNHWHQSGVADFSIRSSPDGPSVGVEGFKTTFCLIDVEASDQIGRKSERVYWDCNAELQGISVGWGDEYHQSTPLQELDITGLPAGVYYLTHDGDPDQHWLETDDANNNSWVKFQLVRKGANASVKELETSGYEGNSSNA